ncbi:HD domain-containing protein [Hydrogenispora ethanolica]|jgi:exopolyphosphatase/guanosine-5'-triphosphate,3'-diphosphate pyrophosphatase|uniref:HD domain-containing protein n=1 Tax=Hydrogenispora ethanolica TaxID=1082276 RepID=A0A4R1RUM8_HYDET|nr:HD domain-containing protein [Hydrogenispora ethanolica]TCL70109.1 HD domain-containing protein [Hydrogenispora ethanolica]
MKIALIDDFDGDPDLLRLLIRHARSRGADHVWTDAPLATGCSPNAVLDLIRAGQVSGLLTESDIRVIKARQRSNKLRQSDDPEGWLLARWVYDLLTPENRRQLRLLTRSVRLRAGMLRLLWLNPGEPDPASLSDEALFNLARRADTDIMIGRFGPEPFLKKLHHLQIINPGRPEAAPGWLVYPLVSIRGQNVNLKHQRVRIPAPLRSRPKAWALPALPPLWNGLIDSGRRRPPIRSNVAPVKPARPHCAFPGPEEDSWQTVLEFATGFLCDREELIAHSLQVTRLALILFDQLPFLHRLGAADRSRLQYAAMLHDIGKVAGPQAHHLSTLHIILHSRLLPFPEQERAVIGLIARYHRQAHPNPRHEGYGTLPAGLRQTVIMLAALLRLADGLDHSHRQAIHDLRCRDDGGTLRIDCRTALPAAGEPERALAKGDLFEKVFMRKLVIQWQIC